jgi:hypothetical protein
MLWAPNGREEEEKEEEGVGKKQSMLLSKSKHRMQAQRINWFSVRRNQTVAVSSCIFSQDRWGFQKSLREKPSALGS